MTALKHLVKANLLAMRAILAVRPDAIIIQSEASEYFHAENPKTIRRAEMMSARRFLSLDLNYGRRVDSDMYEYLLENGMTQSEYHFFFDNNLKHHCIMGNDYYITNEHRVRLWGHMRFWRNLWVFSHNKHVFPTLPIASNAYRNKSLRGPAEK